MKKFSKVDTAIKVNISSSWIIYITKNHEDAQDLHRFAMTQKAMMPEGWYYTVQTHQVMEDCRVPEFFHNHDYWMTVIEHNNGDWNKPSNLARQALDEGMRQNRNDYCDSCNLP